MAQLKSKHYWLLASGIFVWTVMLPGVVAVADKVFSDAQVSEKIAGYPEIQAQDKVLESLKQLLNKINEKLGSADITAIRGDEISALLAAREKLLAEIGRKPSRVAAGFYTNSTTSIFFLCYSCLTALVVLGLNEYPSPGLHKGRIVALSLAGYFSFAVFNWIRNAYPHDPARKVYSFVHFDISKVSFLLQEARLLGFFGLIAIVNLLWYEGWKITKTRLDQSEAQDDTTIFNSLAELSHFVSGRFMLWQGASVLLAGAFLPWTYFYWSSLTTYGDRRYVESALLTHLFWGITWVIISMPAWLSLRAWTRQKSAALVSFATDEKDTRVQTLREITPIGDLQLLVTSAIAIASFFAPAIKAVISFAAGR